jgi:hypothetical protein
VPNAQRPRTAARPAPGPARQRSIIRHAATIAVRGGAGSDRGHRMRAAHPPDAGRTRRASGKAAPGTRRRRRRPRAVGPSSSA